MSKRKDKLLCRIDLPVTPPSYWKWREMHWSLQRRLQDAWLILIRNQGTSNTAQKPWKTPVMITCTIYKSNLRGDPANYVTPIDKLFLDNISMPKGNKTRGLGWITDDSPKYMTLAPIKIEKDRDRQHTVIEIWRGVGA